MVRSRQPAGNDGHCVVQERESNLNYHRRETNDHQHWQLLYMMLEKDSLRLVEVDIARLGKTCRARLWLSN